MKQLAFALLAVLALAGLSLPATAQDVGVAAAVNQSAKGTRTNAVRTIAIGDNVIHNERIDTDGVGLVQILLVDGTTFTVGPNSSLVIDSFVYDPNAGTASVAATLTKGVFRFIGGATSKTEGGVKLDTPVGTVGIRGGVADINLNPEGDVPPHVSLIFGNEVTLTQGQELLGRLYQGGYSLAFGASGNIEVVKTPPGWSSQIQAALSGGPGTTGGSTGGPTNQQVANSGVADENSGEGIGANTLDPDVPPLSAEEIEILLLAVATYEELRNEVIKLPPVEPEQPRLLKGFSSGVITIDVEDEYYDESFSAPVFVTSVEDGMPMNPGNNVHPVHTEVWVDEDGNPSIGVIDIGFPLCGAQNCSLRFKSDDGGEVTATLSSTPYTYAYSNFVAPETVEVPLEVSAFEISGKSEVIADLPAGTVVCECDFLEWGGWSSKVVMTDDFSVNEEQYPVDLSGLWVAGDLTTNDQLTELASTTAAYMGTVVGNVSNFTNYENVTSYLATGDLDLSWSFGARAGAIAISDFDGRDFTGTIGMGPDSAAFSGFVEGPGENGFGVVKGGFANDGNDIAAGVLGDVFLIDQYWVANGIFMGEQVAPSSP